MKRWVIDRHGRGEVLTRVSAVALNARELMIIDQGMGLDLKFPFVPASDMAGVVEKVGDGVTRFGSGARVISNFIPKWIDGSPRDCAQKPSYRTLGGYCSGVLADYVCFPENWFTLPVAGLTELSAPTTPIRLKAPVIQGIVTGHRSALEDLVRAVDRIGFKPVIDRRYAFGDLHAALDHLESRAFGKIVIDVSAPRVNE